jgi:hypothetical protein
MLASSVLPEELPIAERAGVQWTNALGMRREVVQDVASVLLSAMHGQAGTSGL